MYLALAGLNTRLRQPTGGNTDTRFPLDIQGNEMILTKKLIILGIVGFILSPTFTLMTLSTLLGISYSGN